MGRVLSNRMDKTVVVEVQGKAASFLWQGGCQRKKYKAHDAENACQIGD